jgi:histidinol-phosphatase (PHP family)
MIDTHVHTSLCNHAQGAMEAYVRRAVDMGFKEICFLDHLTFRGGVHKPGHGLSMVPGEVPLYFQAIQRLKHQKKGIIDIKAGVEIDFNPAYTNLFLDILGTFAFDVVGCSLHFPGEINIVSSGSAWKDGKMDADDVYGLYFEQFEKMLDYDYFDVICHLDLVKKFGRKPSLSFDDTLDNILSKIVEKDLTVEINTSGYDHAAREVYPSPDIIHQCYKKGIRITLGSDAHRPENIGRHYDRAIPMLRSAGYKYLTTFTRRKRSMIAIV